MSSSSTFRIKNICRFVDSEFFNEGKGVDTNEFKMSEGEEVEHEQEKHLTM